MHFLDMVVC